MSDIHERIQQRDQAKQHSLETIPKINKPRGAIPNTPLAVSTISFLLGASFALGTVTWLSGTYSTYWWATYQLGFFVSAWSAFHWGEFAVTAGWNFEKCSVDSFLLDNGYEYHAATGIALLEYLVTLYLKPNLKAYPYVSALGILLTIGGQALRSTAMIHASTNFSHQVEWRKRPEHKLITDGVYAWFRHPSYAGFYYWSLGTQLVLQNSISFLLYLVLLWRFFYYRTRAEEGQLVRFFGEEYTRYRQRVGTKIPFVP